MIPSSIHHVFPFDLRYFDEGPTAWWDTYAQAWPVGAALEGRWKDLTTVHVIGARNENYGKLRVHAGTWSGPGRSTYGNDFSIGLFKWAKSLDSGAVLFVHDSAWPISETLVNLATQARIVGVYHGNSAGNRARLAKQLERHVALRPEVCDGLVRLGVEPARVIEATPSVHERFFRPPTSPPAPTREGIVVGFVGRPYEPKGIDTAVDAVRDLQGKHGNVTFVLAGAKMPEDSQAIADVATALGEVGARLVSLGRVPNSEMPRLMRGWDVLAFPSREEGCPRTVLEAAALGLPVVGSAGVVPDKIVDGIRVRACDPAEFSSELETALAAPPANTKSSLAQPHSFGAEVLDRVVEGLPESPTPRLGSRFAITRATAESMAASAPIVRLHRRVARAVRR